MHLTQKRNTRFCLLIHDQSVLRPEIMSGQKVRVIHVLFSTIWGEVSFSNDVLRNELSVYVIILEPWPTLADITKFLILFLSPIMSAWGGCWSLESKTRIIWNMCALWNAQLLRRAGSWTRKQVNHTSWVIIDDWPFNSVRNRCEIKRFVVNYYLSDFLSSSNYVIWNVTSFAHFL